MNRRQLAWAALAALSLAAMPALAVKPVRGAAAPPEVPDAGPPAPPKLEPAPVRAAEPKKIENPAEVTYRLTAGEHAFAMHVRPGAPRPGETVELTFDVAVIHDPPDAVLGDREPLKDAELVVTLEKGKPGLPHVLHPLENPGQYGAHLYAAEPGVFTVRVGRRSGKPGLDASFPLGIGVATPARPAEVLATAGRGAKGPVRTQGAAPTAGASPALAETMRALGERFLQLDAQVDASKGEAAGTARAMLELAKLIPGTTPPFSADRTDAFGAEAARLQSALTALASSPTRARVDELEQSVCFRCHAQFRFGVASDVSKWPAFTAAPEAK